MNKKRNAYQKNNILPLIMIGLLLVVFTGVGFMAVRFLFSWTQDKILDSGVIPGVSASEETSEHVERQPGQVIPTWTSQERITILVLGIDERQQESGPFRTDTIMLVTLDPTTLQAGVLSIPRDLWVPIPGYTEEGNRINTAHFLGDLYDHPGGGPALAMETVQYNLGVPVDYYARLNFQGFIKLVDLVGGVDIEVEETLHDTAYPDNNYGTEVLHIEAGPHHFDGEMALKYARTRHGTGDFDRARRQQQVMVALLSRVTSLEMLPQLARKAPDIFNTLDESLSTNMALDEILALSGLALRVDREEIRFGVIDASCTQNWVTPSGAQVLIPLREQMREVRDYVFGRIDNLSDEVTPADEKAAIAVRNGTMRPGLATEVSERLQAQGLEIKEAVQCRPTGLCRISGYRLPT